MARKVRNHPVPRDKMSENKLSEQTPKVKTHDFYRCTLHSAV